MRGSQRLSARLVKGAARACVCRACGSVRLFWNPHGVGRREAGWAYTPVVGVCVVLERLYYLALELRIALALAAFRQLRWHSGRARRVGAGWAWPPTLRTRQACGWLGTMHSRRYKGKERNDFASTFD